MLVKESGSLMHIPETTLALLLVIFAMLNICSPVLIPQDIAL